jgi:hypothetical protein
LKTNRFALPRCRVAATAAAGPVDLPFAAAVSLPAGDHWLTQQSGASGQRACLSGTAAGESDFNTDTKCAA